MNWEIGIDMYTTDNVSKTDNQWRPAVSQRELHSVLCGGLNGEEIQKGGI